MEDSQFGQTTFDYDTYNAIYDKAISIISMATQSEKNLRDKLAKYKYPQDILDAVINEIKDYMDDPMTATTINASNSQKSDRSIVTTELIYYWMTAFNIGFLPFVPLDALKAVVAAQVVPAFKKVMRTEE